MSRGSGGTLVPRTGYPGACAPMRYVPFLKTLLLVISGASALVWFAVVLERL